jgi:hypothetical protein
MKTGPQFGTISKQPAKRRIHVIIGILIAGIIVVAPLIRYRLKLVSDT